MNDEDLSGWSARALAQKVGISPSTISSWITRGLVTPELSGRGCKGHTIGLAGLFEILTVMELKQVGFSTQAIRSAVHNIRLLSGKQRPLAGLALVASGNDLVWHKSDEVNDIALSLLRKPGQRLIVFPVGEKHSAVLAELNPTKIRHRDESEPITSTLVYTAIHS